MKRVEITINYKSKNIEENEEFTNTDVYAYASGIINAIAEMAIAEMAIAEMVSQGLPVESLNEISITLAQKGVNNESFTPSIRLRAKCVCSTSTKSECHG